MNFPTNHILKGWLLEKGYEALASLGSFEIEEAVFNRLVDEARAQHPHDDDLQNQSRAIYRAMTEPATSETTGLAPPLAQVVDDAIRMFRQTVAQLAGKVAVIETALERAQQQQQRRTDEQTASLSRYFSSEFYKIRAAVEEVREALDGWRAGEKLAQVQRSQFRKRLARRGAIALAVALLALAALLFLAPRARSEPPPPDRIGAVGRPLPSPDFLAQLGGPSSPARANAAAPSWSENQRVPLSVDLTGALRVNVVAGGGTGGTSSSFGAAFPATGTAAGLKATAAAPAYTEGFMHAFSSDLGGLLRVRCDTGCAAAGDTVGTATSLAALNNAASVALAGENGVNVIFTAAASPVLTVVAEVSPDGGTTWFSGVFLDPVSGATQTSLVNPVNGQWMIGYVGAESNARVRVSAFTSGSITAQLRSTVTRPFVFSYGSDGTNLRAVRTATDGTVRIDPTGTTTQPVSGTVTANAGTGNFNVVGTKSNNAGAPGATNLGTLPAVAQAAAPTYTEGNQVALSTDLSGALRVSGAAGGGVAQTQVRNEGDTAWVNVGVGPESGTALHMPVQIQDTGTSPVAVLSAAPGGTEFALVTRNIPSGTQTISGTVTANQGTAAAATAPWPVRASDGAVFYELPRATVRTASDTLAVAGNGTSVELNGLQSAGLEVTGTFTGLDLRVQVSTDNGTTFRDVDAYDIATETTKLVVSTTGSYAWFIVPGGTSHVRIRVAAIATGSVTAAVRATHHAAKQHVAYDRVPGSLDPSHAISLGASDGTNLQRLRTATAAPAGTEQGLIVRNIPSGTQTVAGTITANQGTPAVTANRWPVQITDGTDLALVTAAGAVQVDGSAVTQPVSGTVTANAGTGNFSVVGTKSNNAGVPGATNLGTLPAVAQAASPTYTEGNQVALSTDLSGALRVSGASGGGVAQTQVRNEGDTAWVNVGVGAESGTALHMPVQIQDTGTNPAAVLNAAPSTEYGLVTRNIPSGTQTISGTVTANQGTAAASTVGWPTKGGDVARVSAAWTSATAVNTTLALVIKNYGFVVVSLRTTTTMTAGTIAFEASDDGTNWYDIQPEPLQAIQQGNYEAGFGFSHYIMTQPPDAATWQVPVGAFTDFRIRLHAVIAGTGTANLGVLAAATPSAPSLVGIGGGNIGLGDGAANGGISSPNLLSTALAVGPLVFNGTTWDRMRGDIANGLDVDVTRLPGTAADNSANSTTKLPVLSARANAAAPTWTEGNQVPLSTDLGGALRVSGTVTANAGTGTFTTDPTDRAARILGQVEGRAASGAAKVGNPVQIGGVFNTTQPTVTTGQAVEAQSTARGAAIVATGVDTFNVTVNAALPTGGNNIGDVDILTFPDNEPFNLGQVAGTATVTGGVAGLLATAGNVAHDAVDAGNPIKVGGKVTTALPGTPPAAGDRVDAWYDTHGRQIVDLAGPRELRVKNNITLTTTTETTLLAAGAAGVFRDLTFLSCSNTSATLVRVDIRDATAGTVLYSMSLAASGGGFVSNFSVPWKQTTAANNWTAQLSAAVTDVRCAAQGVETK